MTPMIDVTFLLIIFFMVSSHLSKQENHLKLDLPSADHALASDIVLAEESVTVNVLESGELRLGAAVIEPEQLPRLLSEKNAAANGKLQVRIRCSKLLPYGRIAPVLRDLVAANVTDVVFAVYEQRSGANE